ncbi:ABC transporter substrate-binding protein [Psychromonas aquimarina]|uniref:ABC transporter substrate-binding protein n=1 Tax=Psychromonas aquimarina TaxID=444919 RepID=UPI00040BDE32|nr:ABC transporter substrate-binding protein [Psychromonas aquimarina]
MFANFKKTKITALVLSAAAAGLITPQIAQASDKSELTIVSHLYPTSIRNFNPFLGTALRTTLGFVYEPLVIFNEMHANKPEFRLATGFEMAEDLKSVTFDIRKGVKWSDGEKFTADDVVFTFNLVNKTTSLDQTGVNKIVTSVKKINEYKVEFTLAEANSNAPYEIVRVPVVAQHVWSKVDKPDTFTNENPVGTGPFTEVEVFTPTLYTQCTAATYWDADNLDVDCIRMPQIANNDQLLGKVINSELDWSASFIPDIDKTYASKNPNHKYWLTPAGTQAFVVNFKNPDAAKNEALTNVDFRRAFSMAIDRETIIDIAFYGNGVVNDFASGLGYAFEAWSDEAVHNKYKKFNTYNVDGAKALLTKAGFKDLNDDGYVETPSGKSFELIIQSPNGWTDFNNTVQLAVENLEEVGIKAKARTPDFAVYNKAMQDATYDVAYTNYFHGSDPHKYWDSAYASKYQKSTDPRFAMHHWKNAKVDALLASFYKTADKAEQIKMANQIQAIIAAEQVTIPVMSGLNSFQYNTSRFSGWWNADNAKGRPGIYAGIPERVLQVLDLKPIK